MQDGNQGNCSRMSLPNSPDGTTLAASPPAEVSPESQTSRRGWELLLRRTPRCRPSMNRCIRRGGGISSSLESTGRRGGVASVRRDRGDADVQEVVGVAQVFAQPLQRSLQQRLDAVDHHLEVFLLTCAEEERTVTPLSSQPCNLHLEFCFNLWQQQREEGGFLTSPKTRK